MSDLKLPKEDVEYLLTPKAVRDRAREIYELSKEGKGLFVLNEERFPATVKYVLDVIKKNYPDGKIPFHSRWGHFRAGKIDRPSQFKKITSALDPMERARAELDLVITSVLLDAGAGKDWTYREEGVREPFARSEGLGVASYHMFLSGAMAADKTALRADAEGLSAVTAADLAKHFQAGPRNPLLGIEGRVQLLNNLGKAVKNKDIFKDGRPGNIVDYVKEKFGATIPAPGLLRAVLDGLGSIWPGRLTSGGVNLGDVWKHSSGKLVPFHKLSQWMTYSLIEPILDAGLKVTEVEGLTGLAEYRNGGLILDSGLVSLRRPADYDKKWKPDTDLIIEWRALTVHYLDRIGTEVQKALNKSPEEFPLAKVLEGGTWWAGRFLAKEKRQSGEPPLSIVSDGTVF
jgi:hypothetical protein